MASNPPFHVEDQTDEDFFDKLVDDDFGPNESSSSTVPKFTEGNESDDARAFANLSIEDSGGGDLLHEMKTGDITVDASATKPVAGEESDSSLMAGKGLVSDSSMIESNNNMVGSEEAMSVSDSERVSKSSAGSGVKEVGWNYFHPDLSENGGHGFGSYSDFFSDLGENSVDFPASRDFSGKVEENVNSGANTVSGNGDNGPVGFDNSVNYGQYQDGQVYGNPVDQSVNGEDLSSSQYWENLYPGWKYDPNTGQWYQVDGYNANTNTLGTYDNSTADWSGASDGKSEISYLRQSAQSVMGTVADTSTTENVSNWSQVSQVNNGYPEHMIFDPQYPGWYYDTIAQEWRTLESYNATSESTVQTQDQHNQNGHASMVAYHNNNNSSIYGDYGQTDKHSSQALGNQGQYSNWAESYSSYNQPDLNIWQPETDAKTETVTETATLSNFGGNQKVDNLYGSKDSMNSHVDREKSFSSVETVQSYEKAGKAHVEANGTAGIQSFIHGGNFSQQFNMGDLKQSEQMNFSNDFYGPQKPVNMAHQSFQSGQQFSYAPNVGRSSAGRPPHALVTFGFGGKLIVMKDNSSVQNSSFGSQDPVGSSISVLNLMEVVTGNSNASSTGGSSFDYFRALCQQSFPGPLVGGNVGSKELNKWIDERIANCESPDLDYRKGKRLSLLLSLLKIACQHYGKLRSPFGTDTTMRESDTPESAVAKLFASAKKDGSQYGAYGALSHCLQQLPSEGQIRATASEVQSLLVSGRKMDALQCAQEGQLWGPALVLASQLGDQFYIDTVKQMALRQLVAGSPLRTLCLLIAGQPAEVFSADNTTDSNLSGPVIMSQQPAQLQIGATGMLNDWEENLAVITANRTKDDELVIIHLGDCLWRERSEITAAHICYLVAEANFEAYSDSARLCLIGADHWKFPRTYASPEAIQRTELYEYSKVLGNSQFILQPFQPYKLIYAYMLAEVGKVSDALKYCQAVLKSLKTGRAPEVETWKQLVLSLEERIRTHQQGGYATNLAPGKLVGKLLNFFDSTAHRVVGGLPPPAPSTSHGNVQVTEHYHQQMAPRVSASQSTMTMSSLMPSASMEPISDWAADGNKMTMHNRSVSEPDFGRSPRQVDSSKEETSSSAQGKPAGSGTASRLGRFGFGSQLLQKTVGLVLRPRSDRQAKLGEKNKFYYDEKLKRWVEEGVEPPAEEAALAPPPTTSAFQNGMSDYNSKPAVKSEGSPPGGSPKFKSPSTSEHSSGIPPIPSNSNQFSARGRMGVRARYVDTFNQGRGNLAKSFQSPSVPSVRPAVAANAKFFVPAPVPPGDQGMEAIAESAQEENAINENHLTSIADDLSQTSTSSSVTMQRVPSMDNITRKAVVMNGIGPHSAHSRRTASWSGSFNDAFSPPKIAEPKPLGEVVGMSPFMPSPMSSSSFGDELHEVEL